MPGTTSRFMMFPINSGCLTKDFANMRIKNSKANIGEKKLKEFRGEKKKGSEGTITRGRRRNFNPPRSSGSTLNNNNNKNVLRLLAQQWWHTAGRCLPEGVGKIYPAFA